jgi:hypothetical protein
MYCLCLCHANTPHGEEWSLVITHEFGILTFDHDTAVRIVGVYDNPDAAVAERTRITIHLNRVLSRQGEVTMPSAGRHVFVVAIVPADTESDDEYRVCTDDQPWEVPGGDQFIVLYAGTSRSEARTAAAFADHAIERAFRQTLDDSQAAVVSSIAQAIGPDN